MENPFGIELPGEFTDERGVRRLRPVWIPEGRVPAEVLPQEARLYALERRPASFEDQLYAYLTEAELAKYVGRPVKTTTFEELVAKVETLPFPGTMRRLAWLQREIETLDLDTESQIGAVHALYGPTVGELCARFLREREHGIALCDVQLFALQRLVMLHARDAPIDEELDRDGMVQLLTALIAVPGTVLSPAEFGLGLPLDTDAPADPADDVWLRFFVGTGAMTTHGSFDHSVARARTLYQVIANSPAARKQKDYCPFDEWLRSAYHGFGFGELQAIGFAMLAGFNATVNEGPPYLIDDHFFSTTAFRDRGREAVAAVGADRDWFMSEFGKSPQTQLRAAREIVPFLLRPALRQEDGRAAIIAPRAITGWLSPSGTYWLFHIAKREKKLDEFFRFHGFLFERYARHLACAAHPDQRRRRLLGTAGIVHGDYPYKHEGESKTSDVAIDLGIGLVLVEMTAKRFTTGSTLDADITKIRNDLNTMVVENMRQLGRVIRHLHDGTARIPGIEMNVVKTVWPVIVAPESTLQSPTFWAYIERVGAHYLDEAQRMVPQQVKPLVVLELEEYERLMGIAHETGRLTNVLERKTSDGWRQRDFKSWHSGDPFRIGSGENLLMQQEWRRAVREIGRTLDLGGRARDDDAGEQDRLAA